MRSPRCKIVTFAPRGGDVQNSAAMYRRRPEPSVAASASRSENPRWSQYSSPGIPSLTRFRSGRIRSDGLRESSREGHPCSGHAVPASRESRSSRRTILEGRHFLIRPREPVKLGIPGGVLGDQRGFSEPGSACRTDGSGRRGYIAAEFSHIAARAGAKVTILQRGERMLAHFDPDSRRLADGKFWSDRNRRSTRTQVKASRDGTGVCGPGKFKRRVDHGRG